MSGLEHNEAAFDEVVTQIDLRPLMPRMSAPWLTYSADYVLPSGQVERRPHPKEART